jgi:hypothetical protein
VRSIAGSNNRDVVTACIAAALGAAEMALRRAHGIISASPEHQLHIVLLAS